LLVVVDLTTFISLARSLSACLVGMLLNMSSISHSSMVMRGGEVFGVGVIKVCRAFVTISVRSDIFGISKPWCRSLSLHFLCKIRIDRAVRRREETSGCLN